MPLRTRSSIIGKIVYEFHVSSRIGKDFTSNALFVLDNTHVITGKPIWKFCWHPFNGEILFGIEPIPHKQIVQISQYKLYEYLRGIFLKEERLVLFRPYFNPCLNPIYDKELSHLIQRACQKALQGKDITYTFDVDNRYLIENFGNRSW